MPKYTTVDEYIAAQAHPQAELLQALREAIIEAVPEAEETINYGVAAFSLVADGRRDQQIMIGAFKHHVGIYPHPETIEQFKDELAGFKQGKGSIQFPLDKPIPKALIVNMVKYRHRVLLGESPK